MARSRYLLFKPCHKWTSSQAQIANILFYRYSDIEKAYDQSDHLDLIYTKNIYSNVGRTNLALLFNRIELVIPSFEVLIRTLDRNYQKINFFVNRGTNTAAESFMRRLKILEVSSEEYLMWSYSYID